VREEESVSSLDKLLADAESILQLLNLPYRVVLLASGDMSFASAKTYDLEVWSPGVQKWLEVSSCSTCKDFQSRRLNTKYKSGSGKKKKTKFVHLLNGSGLALPRILVAIMENYQREDGHIEIPQALRAYMGNREFI
jgi:seryl-tRNA synthetase